MEEERRDRRGSWRVRLSWTKTSLRVDVAMLTAAAVLIELTAQGPAIPLVSLLAFSALVVANLYSRGMYRRPMQLQVIDVTRAVTVACTLAVAIVVTLEMVIGNWEWTAGQIVLVWLVTAFLLTAGRVSLVLSERHARRAGEAGHPTLIVGAGNVGRLVATRLQEHPELGLRPVGFLDKTPLYSEEELCSLPVLGASWDLDRIIANHGIEHVIVAFSTAPTNVLLGIVKRCEELEVRVSFVPRLYENSTEQLTVESLGGIPLVTGHSPRPKSWGFAVKHSFDRLASGLALILLSPILLVCTTAVYLSAGRPIFYRAERVGRDGAKFDMLKFRTMHGQPVKDPNRLNIRSDTGTSGAEELDRLTRVGSFMRRCSLDELPQLFNVFKGDMSLVGPRPERTEYVEVLEGTVHRYGERHRVKSGITGWAQVSGLRGQTSLSDRVEWDNYYIQNWSFWFDLKIMLRTLAVVFRPTNGE